jgi:OOP family OmpA-OmpF porin
VERAITASVQRNPAPLADALFPVMGPAIRKAVASSLAAMVESLNRTLEYGLSWRSLEWRLEAWRTGRPFAEVVLLKTLLYRVEQVFLIDARSGLLLQHVRSGPADVRDADMVSGMLTAIRDFVRDSFRVAEGDALEAFKVGDLTVRVEQGPRAFVAAVVRGTPPPEFRRVLQGAVETVHLQFAEVLEHFAGDASVFEAARPALEVCLQSQYRQEARPRARGAWALLVVVLAALALWAGLAWRERARWNSYLEALRAEPGLVVVSAERSWGRRSVTGLRDPLARDPAALLAPAGLSAADVQARWEPYQALDPRLVLERARAGLRPPPGTAVDLRDGALLVSGTAPAAWLAEAHRLAPLIAGITRLDASPAVEAGLAAITARLAARTPLFVKGSAQLAPGQDAVLRAVIADLRELDTLAGLSSRRVRVDVVGHADADGAPEANLPLSRTRAERVAAAIAREGLSGLDVVALGVGSREPAIPGPTEPEKQRNRRVVVRVAPAGSAATGETTR